MRRIYEVQAPLHRRSRQASRRPTQNKNLFRSRSLSLIIVVTEINEVIQDLSGCFWCLLYLNRGCCGSRLLVVTLSKIVVLGRVLPMAAVVLGRVLPMAAVPFAAKALVGTIPDLVMATVGTRPVTLKEMIEDFIDELPAAKDMIENVMQSGASTFRDALLHQSER